MIYITMRFYRSFLFLFVQIQSLPTALIPTLFSSIIITIISHHKTLETIMERLLIIHNDELPPTLSFSDEGSIFSIAIVPHKSISSAIRKQFNQFKSKNRKCDILKLGRLSRFDPINDQIGPIETSKSIFRIETKDYKNLGATIDKHKELVEFVLQTFEGTKFVDSEDAQVFLNDYHNAEISYYQSRNSDNHYQFFPSSFLYKIANKPIK